MGLSCSLTTPTHSQPLHPFTQLKFKLSNTLSREPHGSGWYPLSCGSSRSDLLIYKCDPKASDTWMICLPVSSLSPTPTHNTLFADWILGELCLNIPLLFFLLLFPLLCLLFFLLSLFLPCLPLFFSFPSIFFLRPLPLSLA